MVEVRQSLTLTVTAFSSDVFLNREAHFREERGRRREKGMLKDRETERERERERVKWAGANTDRF